MVQGDTTTMMAASNDSKEQKHDPDIGMNMMMMMNEEAPPFREGPHQRPNAATATDDMVMTDMQKASVDMDGNDKNGPLALTRGDSSSSRTSSTIAGSDDIVSSLRDSQISSSHSNNLVCRVKELAQDGDWLQQLQYRLYSREEEEALLLRTYRQSRRPSSVNRSRRHNSSNSSHHANGKGLGHVLSTSSNGNGTSHHHGTSTTGGGELCLISGATGLGKTRLARTLEGPVKEDGGYFISAKFDQVQQAKPTRIFADAFGDFTHAVLAQGPEIVKSISREIRETLGDELPLVLSAVPVLEKLVGKAQGAPVQMSCQTAKRFVFAILDLVSAVCAHDRPMVLFFDDLQWADQCSLKLLKSFISCNQNRHLFIVATCDESVGPCSHVSTMLRELEDEGNHQIFNVDVLPKPCRDMWDVITTALPMPEDRHDVLAKFVCGQTGGNPLYIMEFLRWLSDERLLQYDAAQGTWILHDNDVRLSIDACKLGDFLVDKLEKLPDDVREVIKVAACFGNDINEELMNAVFTAEYVSDRMHDATSRGVFVYDQDLGYSFRHDGLQKAALSLIPTEDKEALHLELGRKLSAGFTEEQRDKNLYLILGQLRLGKSLIKDPRERQGVAMLCLEAGQSSAKSSAFGAAAGYLELGIELLDDSWEGDYSLKLALYNAAAEMRLTTSEYERVHELLQPVFDNVPTLKHKLQAYNTLIYAYGVTEQQHLAIETGVKILAELGESFPSGECMNCLRCEARKVNRLLKGKSSAQIMRMEVIKNEEKLAALQILNLMSTNAILVRPKFAPFIQLKSVEITMRHGLSALASSAFGSYGMLLAVLEKYDDAFRYGQLALDLLKKFRSKEYAPRVFAAVYGCIIPWQRPIRECIGPLQKAQQIGSQTGDIEFACVNASIYASVLFFTDVKLPAVSRKIADISHMMTSRRQVSMLVVLKPFEQLTHSLMGLTEDPLVLNGDSIRIDEATEQALETRNATSLVCIRLQKLILNYLFGDFEGAARIAKDIESVTFAAPGLEYIFAKFFLGMTHLAAAKSYKGWQRRKCISKATEIIKKFKLWAENSPHNCLCLKYLLEAELASFQSKTKKAYEKFTASTALAKDNGFKMVEAMSHERCGRHLYAVGNESLAGSSFRNAINCYVEWGATAKVASLEKEVEDMFALTSVQF